MPTTLSSSITHGRASNDAHQEWRKGMGRELKDTKTRFAHTLEAKEECNGNVGFNFLGFTIRQFPVGKYKAKKLDKTIIHPSKNSIEGHYKVRATVIQPAVAEALSLGKTHTLQEKRPLGRAQVFHTQRQAQAREVRGGNPDPEMAWGDHRQTPGSAAQRREPV